MKILLKKTTNLKSQSLFYWIIYSYYEEADMLELKDNSLNPYFIGLSILIFAGLNENEKMLGVSILILLDYLFL